MDREAGRQGGREGGRQGGRDGGREEGSTRSRQRWSSCCPETASSEAPSGISEHAQPLVRHVNFNHTISAGFRFSI